MRRRADGRALSSLSLQPYRDGIPGKKRCVERLAEARAAWISFGIDTLSLFPIIVFLFTCFLVL